MLGCKGLREITFCQLGEAISHFSQMRTDTTMAEKHIICSTAQWALSTSISLYVETELYANT